MSAPGPMKTRFLLLPAICILLSGCGIIGKTLGTAGSLIQTVTAPVTGLLNVAEPGSEKAWREKAAAEKRRKTPPPNDRLRTQAKRRD